MASVGAIRHSGQELARSLAVDDAALPPWDELGDEDGAPRPAARAARSVLDGLELDELRSRQAAATADIQTMGITFTVYSDGRGIDRAWPFDVIPRIIEAAEWAAIARGLEQRLVALNRFIDDIYNDQRVIADGVFPRELLDDSANFRPECKGVRPALRRVGAHLRLRPRARRRRHDVRARGQPAGAVGRQLRAGEPGDLQAGVPRGVRPPTHRPGRLVHRGAVQAARVAGPATGVANPSVVVLTPGIFNSAYFEHSFLAQRMGATLVEGGDLVVSDDDRVFMRTIDGLEPVDVIYRRIDDLFLDPEAFRPDSTLGVPGLMRAWKAGRVAIANAPGAGVADDKVVYAWVPDLVRYYLGEEPLIPNVPTYRCLYADERRFVLDNLRELVVKPANESGGYGIVIGNRATDAQLAAAAAAIAADPRNWVAQPIVQLSTAPTLCDDGVEPRHVDLRPFILTGATSYVTAGGLTRVALVKDR